MRMTPYQYLRIVDEMQGWEVELRRLVLKDDKTSCDSPLRMRTTYLWIVDEMKRWEVELRSLVHLLKDDKPRATVLFKDVNELPVDRGWDAGPRSWTADDKHRATVHLRMRTSPYLRIVDEMQSREVELRRLILLFLFPVRLFDVLQILFPLTRLLICSEDSTDHR